jgi:hypothetical protein
MKVSQSFNAPANSWQGEIAFVGLYDRALTGAENGPSLSRPATLLRLAVPNAGYAGDEESASTDSTYRARVRIPLTVAWAISAQINLAFFGQFSRVLAGN